MPKVKTTSELEAFEKHLKVKTKQLTLKQLLKMKKKTDGAADEFVVIPPHMRRQMPNLERLLAETTAALENIIETVSEERIIF